MDTKSRPVLFVQRFKKVCFGSNHRDLNNGFLIAEIFTRYFPSTLSMHSFDNSFNTAKMNNNWFLLDKFFKKNTMPFTTDDFGKIKLGDFEQLVTFMIKLYTFLTKRQ